MCNNAGVNVNRSLARPIYATTPIPFKDGTPVIESTPAPQPLDV
ncbi:MAG: hypothetical protein VB143_07290 [Burkholderia sp.]